VTPIPQHLTPQAPVHDGSQTAGMLPATHGGQYGMQHAAPIAPSGWAPGAAPAPPAAATHAPPARSVATQLTGAYQSSGDAGIDRMLRFEAAAKRFGSFQ
jgi:hypothetical protein